MIIALHISGFALLSVSRVIIIWRILNFCNIPSQRLIIIFCIHFGHIQLLISWILFSFMWKRIWLSRRILTAKFTKKTPQNVGNQNSEDKSTHRRNDNIPSYSRRSAGCIDRVWNIKGWIIMYVYRNFEGCSGKAIPLPYIPLL